MEDFETVTQTSWKHLGGEPWFSEASLLTLIATADSEECHCVCVLNAEGPQRKCGRPRIFTVLSPRRHTSYGALVLDSQREYH